MKNKWMYMIDVERKLGATKEQLNRAIKVMEKYHYFENWIWYRLGPTNDLIVLFNLEFVSWLKEVYFNRNGFFLDREIHFLNARILDMESKLGISHLEKAYPYLNVKELQEYFGKSSSSILKAIERMNRKIDCKCYRKGNLYITPTGVKWLYQNYYRKSYFKELLDYKQKLNEKENKND